MKRSLEMGKIIPYCPPRGRLWVTEGDKVLDWEKKFGTPFSVKNIMKYAILEKYRVVSSSLSSSRTGIHLVTKSAKVRILITSMFTKEISNYVSSTTHLDIAR